MEDEAQLASSTSSDGLVLVTGVTGRQGQAVSEQLIKRGFTVRGLVRNTASDRAQALIKKGIDIKQGDFLDPSSLQVALQGVSKLFLYTPDVAKEISMGRNVIDAARTAGVGHLVYTSSLSTDPEYGMPEMPKGRIEEYLRNSGVPYTILRPAAFMDNYAGAQPKIAASGILTAAPGFRDPRRPDGLQQYISVEDIGFFVAEAFDDPQTWLNTEVNIASDELSGTELAALFSRIMGRKVAYSPMSWQQWEEFTSPRLVKIFRWYENSNYRVNIRSLRSRYPKLNTFENYLKKSGWENWQDKDE